MALELAYEKQNITSRGEFGNMYEYKLTGKVVSKGLVIEYTTIDLNGRVGRIDKATAIALAKEKRIKDVDIKTVYGNEILFGINGFSLNNLPEIKKEEYKAVLIVTDISGSNVVGFKVQNTRAKDAYKFVDTATARKLIESGRMQAISDSDMTNGSIPRADSFIFRDRRDVEVSNFIDDLKKSNEDYLYLKSKNPQLADAVLFKLLETTSPSKTVTSLSKFNEFKNIIIKQLDKYHKKELRQVKIKMIEAVADNLKALLIEIRKLPLRYKKNYTDAVINMKKSFDDIIPNSEDMSVSLLSDKLKVINSSIEKCKQEISRYEQIVKDDKKVIEKREEFIQKEIASIAGSNPNSNIKNYKIHIIKNPRYVHYKLILSSSDTSYIKNIRINNSITNRNILSITDVRITPNKSGFSLCHIKTGIKLDVDDSINNLNLIASFMKLADLIDDSINKRIELSLIDTNGKLNTIQI